MAYDPNRNYADEIQAAIASGAPRETVERLNAERNEKIAANAQHYAAKGISGTDQYGTAAQNYVAGTTPQAVQQTATPQAAPQSVPQSAAPTVPQTTDDLRRLAAQTYGRTPLAHADTSAMRDALAQSRDASIEQANNQIERGVTRSVNELARTQEDANAQYQTELNQVDIDERRALDSQALYAAARGDRGGVGAEQYNSIMNAAAQNRVTINNARTKMQTEVGRQIAQLRADGESDKANAFLQATQNYMAQLVQIEQWEQNFNVSVEQFNAEMEQAYLSYLFQLRQADIDTERWEREFAANRADTKWNQDFQTRQAEIAQDQWRQEFNANREDTRWNQDFQTRQAERAQSQWQQEFAANRDDASWQRLFQEGQAAFQRQQAEVSRNQWQQEFDANRADTDKQNALARAESMMNVGMKPDPATMKAAELSEEYVKLYMSAVKAAQELSSAQAAIEMENKQADTLKKMMEAGKTSGTGAASGGDLTALAKAYVQSGADSPKTWLSNNYKSFGFTAKPDNDEFEDAVEAIREKMEKGVEADAGPGMRQSVFAGYKRYIETVMGNGAVDIDQRVNAVTKRIDAMWPELNVKQREDINALLSDLSGGQLKYVPD